MSNVTRKIICLVWVVALKRAGLFLMTLVHVARSTFFSLDYSWNHFVQVVDVHVHVAYVYGWGCLPELSDACHEFIFDLRLDMPPEMMFQLMPDISMGFKSGLSAGVFYHLMPTAVI